MCLVFVLFSVRLHNGIRQQSQLQLQLHVSPITTKRFSHFSL